MEISKRKMILAGCSTNTRCWFQEHFWDRMRTVFFIFTNRTPSQTDGSGSRHFLKPLDSNIEPRWDEKRRRSFQSVSAYGVLQKKQSYRVLCIRFHLCIHLDSLNLIFQWIERFFQIMSGYLSRDNPSELFTSVPTTGSEQPPNGIDFIKTFRED